MSSYVGISPKNPKDYVGPYVYYPSVVVRNRRPTSADYRQPETGKIYAIGGYWLVGRNPTTGTQGELWYLSKVEANIAYWLMLSSGTTGPAINITVPNGVSPIEPDGLGTINFTSSAGTVTITGSSASPNNHTINFDLAGGTIGVDSVQVDAGTLPGVNPVLPDANGLMTVNGAVVANHSVVLESHSRALNTYNLEIQYATSAAATDGTKSGVAHFDSAQFNVDASGFVSLIGGNAAIDSLGVQATSGTGTDPVVPNGSGVIELEGALISAGTNPLRAVSTAANTVQYQVQTSQALAATDSTKVGLANFDSASFAVDANGFVTLSPGISQGTYTPVITGGTTAGTGTYTAQQGNWVKVGKFCLVTVNISWTAHTGTGTQRCSLPFTSTATPAFNQANGSNPEYGTGAQHLTTFALIAGTDYLVGYADTATTPIQIQNANRGYVFQFMYEFV